MGRWLAPSSMPPSLSMRWWESMTPIPRYRQLNDIMVEQRGGHFKALIKGMDELQTLHASLAELSAKVDKLAKASK